jgi:hypothetical protein
MFGTFNLSIFFSAKYDMKGNATYVMAYETNEQINKPINK